MSLCRLVVTRHGPVTDLEFEWTRFLLVLYATSFFVSPVMATQRLFRSPLMVDPISLADTSGSSQVLDDDRRSKR